MNNLQEEEFFNLMSKKEQLICRELIDRYPLYGIFDIRMKGEYKGTYDKELDRSFFVAVILKLMRMKIDKMNTHSIEFALKVSERSLINLGIESSDLRLERYNEWNRRLTNIITSNKL